MQGKALVHKDYPSQKHSMCFKPSVGGKGYDGSPCLFDVVELITA